jgi:hypothetical protein
MGKGAIKNARKNAHEVQGGRCFYCNLPMWLHGYPQAVRAQRGWCRQHGLNRGQAKPLKCTVEHLVAQKDGGTSRRDNLVAACLYCNSRRFDHAHQHMTTPEQFKRFVRVRMITSGWHRFSYAHMLPLYQRIIYKVCNRYCKTVNRIVQYTLNTTEKYYG